MPYQIKVKKKFNLRKELKNLMRKDYRTFLKPAGDMVVENITSNIRQQITPEGSPLKRNKPRTLKRKAKMGWGSKSLIEQFKLLVSKSTYVKQVFANKVVITLKDVRKNIGKFVEAKGYRFFHIGPIVRNDIFKAWRDMIKRFKR